MVVCLTSARFNMRADILRQDYTVPVDPEEPTGEWTYVQDPESGEFVRVWQSNPPSDNPDTPDVNEGEVALVTFKCEARGIIDGGIRVAGTTERFDKLYENIDFVKITFPANVRLTKRDRVTNIRNNRGEIIWKEEELPSSPPTVFDVMGVTPIVDPFGKHIESFALLERSQLQK